MKKLKSQKKLIFIVFASMIGILSAEQYKNNEKFFKKPLSEYVKKNWRPKGNYNNGIRFFEDANGKRFVLKYQNIETAIPDTLGAQIATNLGIPANQVMLLPVATEFIGRPLSQTATLHTHAPGEEVGAISDMPYYVNIKRGLFSEENLDSITKNTTLRKLVAFNILFNRTDSHNNNLFFNRETDEFCAIDFGNIFHSIRDLPNKDDDLYNPYGDKFKYLHRIFPNAKQPSITGWLRGEQGNILATETCDFIQTLNPQDLSPESINTLKDFSMILKQFRLEYPAEKVYNEWMQLADKAKYTYSPQKKECLRITIEYNYHESKRLSSAIDRLTEKSM